MSFLQLVLSLDKMKEGFNSILGNMSSWHLPMHVWPISQHMVSCLLTLSIWRSKHAMHWMLCLLRLSILLSKHIHTFLPITFLISNRFSIRFSMLCIPSFEKLRLRVFQPYHQYYICWYCRYKTRISNAFNAIYVDTVNTKHIHTFLPITSLIFNRFSIHKKF